MTPEPIGDIRYCSQCGRPYPVDDLARFGDQLICLSCKDLYAQRLREGVPATLQMEYAGFWIRVLASLIDGVILFIVQMAIQMFVLPLLVGRESGVMIAVMVVQNLFGVLVGVSYESYFVAYHGATPGKMALGLQVVRSDGSPVSLGRAAGRYFSKILSALILCIGYLMVAFDDQKRGLHDMICETRVIRKR